MIEKISLNHVAVLVPSVRKAADSLRKFDFQIGEEEVFEGEGTKEIYVEREKGNSLLLLEPTKNGPYQRALEKRGPGIHHFAIDVLELDAFLVSLSGSGWLLHPRSVLTIRKNRTAWLARPGFPGLIEVQEQREVIERPLFVERIFLEINQDYSGLLKAVGLESLVQMSDAGTKLTMSGFNIGLQDWLNEGYGNPSHRGQLK